MSDGATKMYEDYDFYKTLCKQLNIEPVSVFEDFYEHMKKIKTQTITYNNIIKPNNLQTFGG